MQPCVICAEPAEGHHFPRTKAAGGRSKIPLCRKHHREAHDSGVVTFTRKYEGRIWRYWFTKRIEALTNTGMERQIATHTARKAMEWYRRSSQLPTPLLNYKITLQEAFELVEE